MIGEMLKVSHSDQDWLKYTSTRDSVEQNIIRICIWGVWYIYWFCTERYEDIV